MSLGSLNKIRLLAEEEIKKIAAGEVVERPSSVVKELLENSIDAGAKKITLYIEQAGKRLIRVVDDGCGMPQEDVMVCFKNHATSKISSIGDIDDLLSFGFRGEALATISSVSKVTMQTCCRSINGEDAIGLRVEYADGKFLSQDEVACAPGTDLFVRDLFYNTPVRRKFLKQDETEWNQIQILFQAFCLSHLDIHFQLYRDDRMVFNVPPVNGLVDRVMQLWGHNMAQNLIEVHGDGISGLISNYNFWRYGRQQIFFFVNGRWVKNNELSKGLMKGYRNVLPSDRFPAAFIFIDIDKALVDINVHPRKEEVRFAKPGTITNNLQNIVTKSLEVCVNTQLASSTMVSREGSFDRDNGHVMDASFHVKKEFPQFNLRQDFSSFDSHEAREIFREEVSPYTEKVVCSDHFHEESDIVLNDSLCEMQRDVNASVQAEIKIIGQLLHTYIVIENDQGLLLIDQHAAHERILYEKYLKNFEQKDGTRLLFPEVVQLQEYQLKLVLQEKGFLLKQGIEVEQIGEGQLAIKTSPPKIESSSLRELIFEMLEFIEQNDQLDEEVFRKRMNEHMHGQLACKMAIKAGDVLSIQMMTNLVRELQEVDNRFICVHGRPTSWSVSKIELEKRFRRRG